MSDVELISSLERDIKVFSGFAFSSAGFSQVEGLPLIRIRDLECRDTEIRFKGSYDSNYLVKKNDVLIGMDGDFEVCRWRGDDALLNQRVCKVEVATKKVDQNFLFWYLKPQVAGIHRKTPQTTVRHLSAKDLLCIPSPSIDVTEQKIVAKILDTLDTAIQETEAIIAKLKAVKQGLLHDLLTRGIDANGELRPPQSEAPELYKMSALGWIPREWVAAKFAEIGEVILGRQSAPKYRSGSNMKPYLRVVNVADDRLDLRDVKTMNFDSSDFARFRLQYGDILLTEGDLASAYTVGRSAVYRGEIEGCCFQNTLLRLRPNQPQYADFFHYACCHLRVTGRFAVATTATTVHHLSAGRLERDVLLPAPPLEEMEAIARKLTVLEVRIDSESDVLRKRREHKAGLMDDLLTGRVRVTPLLPAHAEESP